MRLAETNIVRHAYSHFKITLHTYLCRYKSGTARPLACDAVKWIAPKDAQKKHKKNKKTLDP